MTSRRLRSTWRRSAITGCWIWRRSTFRRSTIPDFSLSLTSFLDVYVPGLAGDTMNSQLAITASVGSKDDTRERVSSDECRRGVTSRTTTEVSASPDEALEVRRLRDRKDGRRLQRTALKPCALHEATARTCAGSRKARYGAGCRRSPPTGRKRAENPLSLPSKDQINEPGRACQSIDREGELTRPGRGLSQFGHNALSAL